MVSRRGAGSWAAIPTGTSANVSLADRSVDRPRPCRATRDPRRSPPPRRPRCPASPPSSATHGYYEQGLPDLRERLADRYTERGLPTTPDQILVTNGAHSAFAIALRLFVGPGDRVLIEQPSYPNAIEAIQAAHADARCRSPWPTTGGTSTVSRRPLRQSAPRLAYLIVDFHNPTGHRLDAAGRQRLAAAFRRARTPVVVDETQVELDFDAANAPLPFGAFSGDLVLAVGSASKSYWGGLRLGWVRAPAEIITRLMAARRGLDLGSPVFEQLVLTELLDGPAYAVARTPRRCSPSSRDALVAAVRELRPDWRFTVPDGGLCLWCQLPQPVSTRIAAVARNFGVRVVPGSFFTPNGGLERWLRVPYTQPVDMLREATRRLAAAAASVAECGAPIEDNGLIPVT